MEIHRRYLNVPAVYSCSLSMQVAWRCSTYYHTIAFGSGSHALVSVDLAIEGSNSGCAASQDQLRCKAQGNVSQFSQFLSISVSFGLEVSEYSQSRIRLPLVTGIFSNCWMQICWLYFVWGTRKDMLIT